MFINGTPVKLRGMSDELVVQLEEQNYRYRGVICDRQYKRVYLDDAAYFSHVIGYVIALPPMNTPSWPIRIIRWMM